MLNATSWRLRAGTPWAGIHRRHPEPQFPPAILLRESYRENGKIKKRTLANLGNLPMEQVEALPSRLNA